MRALSIEELEKNAEIGYNIKIWRTKCGMTQRELAEALGISQAYMTMLEVGTRPLTVLMGIDLAKILGCTLAELAGKNV